MNPDHQPPDPRLVRPLDWRWTNHPEHGEVPEVRSRRTERWIPHTRWTSVVFEGVEEGRTFDEMVEDLHERNTDRFDRTLSRRLVGRVVFSLYLEGYVELPYDPPTSPVGGRFAVEEELGRGAVGVVWRGRDRSTGEAVSVKMGWDYFQPLDAAEEKIQHEAEVLSHLDHPGVPKVLDIFREDDRLVLIRGYVEGPPLAGSASTREGIARAAAGVAEVLQHLHDRGYVLLDVTPRNFLATTEGPVLIDPGLCHRLEDGRVELGSALGSPGFRAPEVRSRRVATPRTDVNGLGRLVFHLCQGRSPPQRWDGNQLADAVEDPELREIVRALCRTEPEERPTMEGARRSLARVAGDRPGGAR